MASNSTTSQKLGPKNKFCTTSTTVQHVSGGEDTSTTSQKKLTWQSSSLERLRKWTSVSMFQSGHQKPLAIILRKERVLFVVGAEIEKYARIWKGNIKEEEMTSYSTTSSAPSLPKRSFFGWVLWPTTRTSSFLFIVPRTKFNFENFSLDSCRWHLNGYFEHTKWK